ncbi:MAG: hypothetical protein IPO81_00620 [Kouleothrix sp.]|nr:hypothetical protein [Kouleothrix sp.]
MMTQQKHYHNPYDFVPLEGMPTYLPTRPVHEQVTGLCGGVLFAIEVLTPLCIHHDPGKPDTQNRYAFANLGGRPILPATSLKGMLRSVHEAVTNSTLGMLKSENRRGWYRRRIPKSYLPPADRVDRLTASEALFGVVVGKDDESADAKGRLAGKAANNETMSYAGRLLFNDIPITVRMDPQRVSRPQGGQPKPEHESFYFDRSGAILGRKFYYHQQDYKRVLDIYRQNRGMREIEVWAVPAGTWLNGNLRFFNLSEFELAALLYSLVLEDGLAHKLGYGKPLGLGSIHIRVEGLEVERIEGDIPARFLSYGERSTEDWADKVPNLREAAKAAWLARPGGESSYAAFVAVTRWPQTENFIYPEFDFFRRQRNTSQQTTLWDYQNRSSPHPGAMPITRLSATTGVAPTTANLTDITPLQQPTPSVLAESVPVVGPRVVVDLRLIGQLEDSVDIGPFVRGKDNRRYRLTAESASRDVLRGLLARMEAGKMLEVRYRPDKQRIEGRHQNVARDVEPVEEDE